MVLSDDDHITEAMMYQPYGTVSDVTGIVSPSADPLRKKFTGNEIDENGVGDNYKI